jgi:hypothetical protein
MDGAVYRGAFALTFTKTGAVTGRVFYNEATELEGAQGRLYSPVTRSFSGMLAASPDNPLEYRKVIKLGTGVGAGRQELTLTVSFDVSPPTVNVSVKDFASPGTGADAWISQSLGCQRTVLKLPPVMSIVGGNVDVAKAAGNYTMFASVPDPTNSEAGSAYVLAQLLPTGRTVWMSRQKGVLGTGSAGVRITDNGLASAFYEGRSVSTTKLLKTMSLIGDLNFAWDSTAGSWSAHFGSDALPNKLEKQESYVSRSGGKPAYNDVDGTNWTGVSVLDFSSDEGVRWGNSTVLKVPEFLSGTNGPLFLKLSTQDPLPDKDGNPVVYDWRISVSAAGKVSAVSLVNDLGALSPKIVLNLDRQRGEFSGYYSSNSSGKLLRRNVYGCALRSDSVDSLRARGWMECGALPAVSAGAWELKLDE